MTVVALAELPCESPFRDDELLADVAAGRISEFAVLVRRYNRRLYRVARTITGDSIEAEDVVQQTFLAAFQNLSQFAGRAKFSTWLTRIAVNEALAHVRRRRRSDPSHLEDALRTSFEEVDTPEQVARRRQSAQQLEDAIDELAPRYRTVLVMRDLEEMTTTETAAALELTEQAVRVRLHRARASLRNALIAQEDTTQGEPFPFAGARCDRIVASVLGTILPHHRRSRDG